MTDPTHWISPYSEADGFWLKGNLHTHSTNSDGAMAPDEVVRFYEDHGYDFLAITDHAFSTENISDPQKMILLYGNEMDFKHPEGPWRVKHTNAISAAKGRIVYDTTMELQQAIDANVAGGNLVFLNHPEFGNRDHFTIQEMLGLKNYHGIEIYNAVGEILPGSALTTTKWDQLLWEKRRVWGYANQDLHQKFEFCDVANIVRVKERTPAAILHALLTGNFYGFYGVVIDEITMDGRGISVRTQNASVIRFIGQCGSFAKKVRGAEASISFEEINEFYEERYEGARRYCRRMNTPYNKPDRAKEYIRVECLGAGEDISWTQPFFHQPKP